MITLFLLLKLILGGVIVGMARVLGNPNGEFRGKLGGMVFSRGTAGPTVRVKAKPTNPKTQAQQTARNGFRMAGKGFATLSQALQGGWLTFAANLFNPLKKKHTGNTTGAQAYTGIQATINGMGAHIQSLAVQLYGGAVVGGTSLTSFVNATNPPLSSVSPNIADTATSAASFKLRNLAWTTGNLVYCDLDLLGLQGGGLGQGHLIDNKGNQYGIAFYVSDALNFVGQKPKNQYHSLLGFSGLVDKAAGMVLNAHGIRFVMDCSSFVTGHKTAPTLGQIYMISVVLVASNGTVTKVDSAYVTYGGSMPALPT